MTTLITLMPIDSASPQLPTPCVHMIMAHGPHGPHHSPTLILPDIVKVSCTLFSTDPVYHSNIVFPFMNVRLCHISITSDPSYLLHLCYPQPFIPIVSPLSPFIAMSL